MISKETLRKIPGIALRYLLPPAFTVLLLVYLFHIVDFSRMWEIITHGVDYWWILLAMGLSIFSHMFRAARWQIQLNALDIKPPFLALTCSIFGCYALNLVFPRLGEVWRCTYIASFKKNSFTTVLGSMLGDRLADFPVVGAIIVLCLIVAAPALTSFFDKYPVGRDFVHTVSQFWFWAAIVGGIALVILILWLLRHTAFVTKLRAFLASTWQGFIVILRMKGRFKFLILSLCLWGCYFVQLYVAFYAFDFTRALCHDPHLAYGLTPCLVAFVLSSVSMLIPSNGGLGPWNLAIMFGLAVYGVSDAEGSAFSMLQWSGQTVMLIILGIFTMIYISLSRHKFAINQTAISENDI